MGGYPYSQVMGNYATQLQAIPQIFTPRNPNFNPLRNTTQRAQINAVQSKTQSQPNPSKPGRNNFPPPRNNTNVNGFNNPRRGKNPNSGGFGGNSSVNFRQNTAAAIGVQSPTDGRPPIVCYSGGHPGHMATECKAYRDSYNPDINYRHVCTTCGERGHLFNACNKNKGN
jgi:hypothetical protein